MLLRAALRLIVVQFKAIQVLAERVERIEQKVMGHAFGYRQLHRVVGSCLV